MPHAFQVPSTCVQTGVAPPWQYVAEHEAFSALQTELPLSASANPLKATSAPATVSMCPAALNVPGTL